MKSDQNVVCCVCVLKQFGEIEDCQIDENNLSAVITYKTRAEAEQVPNFFTPDIQTEISIFLTGTIQYAD